MPPRVSTMTNLFQDNQCISKAWWDARVTWTDLLTATNQKKKQPAIFRGDHVSFRTNNRKTCHKLVPFLKTFAKMQCNKDAKIIINICLWNLRVIIGPQTWATSFAKHEQHRLQVEFGCLNERKSYWIMPLKKLTAKYPGGQGIMYHIDSTIEIQRHCKYRKPSWTNSFNMAGTLWFAL